MEKSKRSACFITPDFSCQDVNNLSALSEVHSPAQVQSDVAVRSHTDVLE